VTVAFQPLVTFWLPAKVQPMFQLLSAEPLLVRVTFAVNPLSHWFTSYLTEQAAVAADAEEEFSAAAIPPDARSARPAAIAEVLRRTVGTAMCEQPP